MRAGTFNIHDYLNRLYEASEEKEEKDDEKEKKEDKVEEKESADKDEEKEDKKEDKPKGQDNKSKGPDNKKAPEKKENSEEKPKDEGSSAKSSPSSSEAPKTSGTPPTNTASPSAPKAQTGNVVEDGITMPAENKKFYSWLKGEYQKGKTEVKVEMKLGDAKFEPGYELQTNLDSVKDFKPGMYGEVKTAQKGETFGNKQPNTNNQVTGLSQPSEQPQNGKELAKTKPISVKSEPTKPMPGGEGKPQKAEVGKKPATPAAPEKPEEKDAEVEKIDIKTKKAKDDDE